MHTADRHILHSLQHARPARWDRQTDPNHDPHHAWNHTRGKTCPTRRSPARRKPAPRPRPAHSTPCPTKPIPPPVQRRRRGHPSRVRQNPDQLRRLVLKRHDRRSRLAQGPAPPVRPGLPIAAKIQSAVAGRSRRRDAGQRLTSTPFQNPDDVGIPRTTTIRPNPGGSTNKPRVDWCRFQHRHTSKSTDATTPQISSRAGAAGIIYITHQGSTSVK